MLQNFLLEVNKEVALQSLLPHNYSKLFNLIQKNEEYLEKAGEGYPNIENGLQYQDYLISIYGDHEAVSMKRFTILYNRQPVGQIGLHSFIVRNFMPSAEIFYWIDEKFQGKGIVTRACQRIQHYAFNTLGIELLYIHCSKVNQKSENVAKRCQFVYEGISRFYENKKKDYKEYKRYVKTSEDFYKQLAQ